MSLTPNVIGSLVVYHIDDKTCGNTGYNDGRRLSMGLTRTF